MVYKLYWSENALFNLENILDYLETNWTKKEVGKFKILLSKNLELITIFPAIFPKSETVPELRRAVISKHVSVFYRVSDNVIYIVHLFDNRQDISKIEK